MKIYDLGGVVTNLINKNYQPKRELPLTDVSLSRSTSVYLGETHLDISAEARQLGLVAIYSNNIDILLNLLATAEQQVNEIYINFDEIIDNLIKQGGTMENSFVSDIEPHQLTQLIAEIKTVTEIVQQGLAVIFGLTIEELNLEQLSNLENKLQVEFTPIKDLVQKITNAIMRKTQTDNLLLSAENGPSSSVANILTSSSIESTWKQIQDFKWLVSQNLSEKFLPLEIQLNTDHTAVTPYLLLVLVSTIQSIYRQRLRLRSYQRLLKVIHSTRMLLDKDRKSSLPNLIVSLDKKLIEFITQLFVYQATCIVYATDQPDQLDSNITPAVIRQQIFAYIDLLYGDRRPTIKAIEKYILQSFSKATELFGTTLPQISYDTLELALQGLASYL